MNRTALARSARRIAPVLPALAAGAIGAGLAWRRWIDVLADSGREFDVPARVAAGERLLHEIPTYYYGPLWPWTGGALIRLFGRHFSTLEIPAAAFAVTIVVGLFFTVRRCAGPLPAAIAAALAAAISLAAFTPAALLFPYSVSNSIALAAGFLTLATIGYEGAGPVAFFCLTAVILSRPEVGIALAGASILAGWRATDRRLGHRLLIPALAAAAVAGIAYGTELRGIPFDDLLEHSPLVLLAQPAVLRRFFLDNAGLLDIRMSARTLMGDLVIVLLTLAALAAVSAPKFFPRVSRRTKLLAVAAGAAAAAAVRVATQASRSWSATSVIFVSVPLVCAVAAILLLARPIRTEHVVPFLLFVFVLATAVRVFFRIRLDWITAYSAFAFPPVAAAAAVLLMGPWILPGVDRNLFGRQLAIVAAAVIVVHLSLLAHYRTLRRGRFVETPAGAVWMSSDRAEAFECLITEVAIRANPGDGLIAFPEGGFFNFVTGLRNPLGESIVMPGILRPRTEHLLAARLEKEGPRFVVLANRPTPEYDEVIFGVDYAQSIFSAIGQSYHPAALCGPARSDARVGSPTFFLRLYERNTAAASPESSQ